MTGTMPTPDTRFRSLSILILAGVLIGLPWATGGRSPVGQVTLVLLLVLAAAAASFSRGSTPLLRPSPLLLLGGLLAGGSAVQTIYPDRTVQTLLLLLAYLLAGALAAWGAREVPWAERVLLNAVLASGLLVGGIGMVRLLQDNDVGVYARSLTGPFGYPNAMGGFLLLTGGAALAMAQENGGPVMRCVAILAGALSVVGLFLTGSRGILLAGFAGFALWVAIQRQTWWARRRLWFSLAAVGLLVVLMLASGRLGGFPSRLWNLAATEDSSFLWRWHILRWTWAMAWDHPWWGVGPGAFPVALTHYQRLPYVSGINPHNLYLELVAEYGFLAGLLATLTLVGFLARVALAITRAPTDDPRRGRLAGLLAALIGFAVHSLVDLDWSYPAIAVVVATMLGLAFSHLPPHPRPLPSWGRGKVTPAWRVALILCLATAALLAITRYYATTLTTWAQDALTTGETAIAQRDLAWALRLNAFSFPAHQWMARARLRARDVRGAVEVADRTVRMAPSDPNSLYLAGEIAAAAGRWDMAEDRFRGAVARAPLSQLRFHAGLVEASARTGKAAEARWRYEQAVALFTPERVLEMDARCLAPGDRYLLARMSRIAAQLYAETGDGARSQAVLGQAQRLAQPDTRGICASQGRPGQVSPEAAAESFWQALSEGGWPVAERFLAPELRHSRPQDIDSSWGSERQPHRTRLAWVAALVGGERQANLRSEVEVEFRDGKRTRRCTQMDLRLIGDGWFIDRPLRLELGSCEP